MSSKEWKSIEKKKNNIGRIQRIIFILAIVFLFSMTGILFVEKKYENKTIEYINKIHKQKTENFLGESIDIDLKKIDYLKNMDEYRNIIYSFLVTSSIVLMILLKYMKKEMNEHQKDLEDLILVDEITGGYTRIAFRAEAESIIKSNNPSTYTMVLININNFKLINNKFGFREGDRVLKYIYHEIKNNLKEDEFVCRSEIDNFFICIKENKEEIIKQRLRKIENDINKFKEKDYKKYDIQFKYGIALISDIDKDFRSFMNYARFSCSNYKKNREFENYSKIVEQASKENKINSIFEDSLKNSEFKIYLQPKINLKNNKCESAEALVRWIHPQYGMIYPGEFIDLFEENEKVIKLDLYLFEEVCKIIKEWIDEGKIIIPISINLSKKHIKNIDFMDEFIEIKKKYNIPDGILEFEIIESLALDNEKVNIFIDLLEKIHKSGFKCSLDDFGFGYSSLAILSKLNVDEVKLDRRFFMDLKNEKSKKIIEGFIKICKELKIKVVAEGIETEEQLKYLKEIECEIVQGFIFSRAIDVELFEKTFLS